MHLSAEFKNQLLASIPVIFLDFMEGLGYGWTSPTLRRIMDNPSGEMTFTTAQASWIGSLHEAGRIFGPLLTISLLGRIGRKGVLTTSTLSFCIAFSLIAFTRSVPIIYASRLAFGIACGMSDVTSSIYLSENFKSTHRAFFASIAVAGFFGAYLLELSCVNLLNYDAVAYMNTVIALLMLSGSIFVSTETVPFLIAKEKYERAWQNFLWLRGKEDAKTCTDEMNKFEQLKRQIGEERKEERTITAYLGNPLYREAITLVFLFCVLTIATGFSAVTSYVSMAFTEGAFTPNEYAIIFGALQFASSVLTPIFVERANRRTILITSLTISMSVHLVTALLFFLRGRGILVPGFSWWVFTTITVYALTYSSGILTIFYTTRGELMPQNIRALGGSVVMMSHGLVGFLTAKVFLIVDDLFGMYWNFLFYALMSFVCSLFVYFALSETRGKSLREIQTELHQRRKVAGNSAI